MCVWELTGLLLRVPLAGLSESHQGPEVGSEYRPAESGRRVDAHQPADEGVLAALQQSDDVRTHVVRVLLPEILRVKKSCSSVVLIVDFIGSPPLVSATAVGKPCGVQRCPNKTSY